MTWVGMVRGTKKPCRHLVLFFLGKNEGVYCGCGAVWKRERVQVAENSASVSVLKQAKRPGEKPWLG